jgi:hypothetical protein
MVRGLLARAQQHLQRRNLEPAAQLLLHGYRPLGFVAGQAFHLLTPLILLLGLDGAGSPTDCAPSEEEAA